MDMPAMARLPLAFSSFSMVCGSSLVRKVSHIGLYPTLLYLFTQSV